MLVSILIGYILISALVSLLSVGRRISYAGVLTISLFLTPVIGLVAVLRAEHSLNISHYVTRFSCPHCQMQFTEPHTFCPFCSENQIPVRLLEVKQMQTA